MQIIEVESPEDVEAVKTLIYEFIDWLAERYPDKSETIESYFSSQGFDQEMADLLSVFGPPRGACFLAKSNGEPVGCLMMKPHGDDEVEMNRMYVRASARGQRVGETLTEYLFAAAREKGYKRMVLNALSRHHEALPLYYKMGFTIDDRPPETNDPDEIVMARNL